MILILLGFCSSASSFLTGEEWHDENGTFIQAHGGNVQWYSEYDCFNDGYKGCWIWYGEDKTEQQGVHCYISKDLYNWYNKGTSLYVHNVMPEQLTPDGHDIELNLNNLEELKRRANMKEPTSNVSAHDIEIAHNFVEAYVTEIDKDGNFVKFDEQNLITAFRNLFIPYCIIERPKVVYNKKNNNYVMIFHADGPRNSDVVNWINDGMSWWDASYSYIRACLGFAISDTPFGPFKLINVQRMHYVNGWHDDDRGMARDQTVFIDDDERAYAIYSSENNQFIYISRLNEDFTTWDVPQEKAVEGVDFKGRVLNWQWREAPAVFKYNGYYYMMTSGTSGWAPNAASWHRATSLYGPYEDMGNPAIGSGSERTFDSQSTYFIVYNQTNGQFIYFGDRWWSDNLWWSRYVWLPVELNKVEHTFNLYYTLEWKLEDKWPGCGPQPVKYTKALSDGSKKNKKLSMNDIVAISMGCIFVVVIIAIVIANKVRSRARSQESYDQI